MFTRICCGNYPIPRTIMASLLEDDPLMSLLEKRALPRAPSVSNPGL